MVFVDPKNLRYEPYWQKWVKKRENEVGISAFVQSICIEQCRQSLVELIPSRTIISGQPGIDGKLCCQNFSFHLNYCLFFCSLGRESGIG